jgi:hypothetical protein
MIRTLNPAEFASRNYKDLDRFLQYKSLTLPHMAIAENRQDVIQQFILVNVLTSTTLQDAWQAGSGYTAVIFRRLECLAMNWYTSWAGRYGNDGSKAHAVWPDYYTFDNSLSDSTSAPEARIACQEFQGWLTGLETSLGSPQERSCVKRASDEVRRLSSSLDPDLYHDAASYRALATYRSKYVRDVLSRA